MKKVVFITGSTRGIGRSGAFAFAKKGYTVILNGRKETEKTKKLIKDIQNYSSKSQIFYFDISKQDEVIKYCQKIIAEYKKVDVLINNAGIVKDRTFLKMSFEEWDDVIKTNLYGAFYITKQILPVMIEKGFGRIINISSIIGVTGNFGQTNYSASKAAILGFTKSLAKEMASRNITVNAVCPGFVDTEMSAKVPKEYIETILEKIPLKRMAKPEEIAELLTYLASEESAYITGSEIHINGGLF